jgi:hypothetical protein
MADAGDRFGEIACGKGFKGLRLVGLLGVELGQGGKGEGGRWWGSWCITNFLY